MKAVQRRPIARFVPHIVTHVKKTVKQWLWFVGLWCAGTLTVAAAAYAMRWLVRLWL